MNVAFSDQNRLQLVGFPCFIYGQQDGLDWQGHKLITYWRPWLRGNSYYDCQNFEYPESNCSNFNEKAIWNVYFQTSFLIRVYDTCIWPTILNNPEIKKLQNFII